MANNDVISSDFVSYLLLPHKHTNIFLHFIQMVWQNFNIKTPPLIRILFYLSYSHDLEILIFQVFFWYLVITVMTVLTISLNLKFSWNLQRATHVTDALFTSQEAWRFCSEIHEMSHLEQHLTVKTFEVPSTRRASGGALKFYLPLA